MNQSLIKRLAETFLLPTEVVEKILELDIDSAMEQAMSERIIPSQNYQPNQYDVKLGGYSTTPEDMVIQYYDRLDSSKLTSSEPEENIKNHDSYVSYLELSKQGSEPPPISVIKQSSGVMVSINRRRLLVAQELNKPIGAWVESDTAEYGSTLTLGAFNDIKAQIENENRIDLDDLAAKGFDVTRVWYHGTAEEFDKYDLEKFGTNEPKGDYVGKAIFFATNEETAMKYAVQAGGSNVMRVFLKMDNCLNVPDAGLDLSFYDGIDASKILKPAEYEALKNHPHINKFAHLFMEQSERAAFFKSKGYDGFIEEKSNQAAVLSAEQIFILPPDFKIENKVKIPRLKM